MRFMLKLLANLYDKREGDTSSSRVLAGGKFRRSEPVTGGPGYLCWWGGLVSGVTSTTFANWLTPCVESEHGALRRYFGWSA